MGGVSSEISSNDQKQTRYSTVMSDDASDDSSSDASPEEDDAKSTWNDSLASSSGAEPLRNAYAALKSMLTGDSQTDRKQE